MKYAITGASGPLGRLAAEALLRRIEPDELVLVTRSPDRLADLAARGVNVRAGDFSHPDTLPAAFDGTSELLLISTDAVGARVPQHQAAVSTAARAGVRRIVYTSVPEPTADNPAFVVPDHAATEAALRDSGLRWTVLRNNLYAEYQLDALQHATSSGRYVTNTGAGRAAYVTRADCAAAAAGALVSREVDDTVFDVTGPRAFDAQDMARLAAGLGARPVEVQQLDDDAYTAALVTAGVPEALAGGLTSFGAAIRLGHLGAVTDAVQRLSGAAPAPLETLLPSAAGSASPAELHHR